MMTPSETVRDAIDATFPRDEQYAFLIGAGVSMNPPSSVPGARAIVKSLLSFCAPGQEVEPLANHPALRYELLVEWIKTLFDPNLKFLEYLDLIQDPNVIHLFLARLVEQKHVVITTNFDHLIEYALLATLPPEKHVSILPVITRHDFITHQDIRGIFDLGRYPVVKIHGSRKNLITSELTLDTLITTISSLGKDKEEGSTFAVESHKKPLAYNALAGRVLVVMGYSGSDDFDITPLLMEVPFVKKLVWIEHDNVPSPVIARIDTGSGDGSTGGALSRTDQLLRALGQREAFEVVKVRCNTAEFIRNRLWPQLVSGDVVPPALASTTASRPDFKEWIQPIFKDATIPQKYFFAAQVFYYLKELEATGRCCRDGLATIASTPGGDVRIQTQLLNLQGNIENVHGQYQDALKCYLEAYKLDHDEIEREPQEAAQNAIRERLTTDLNNLGTVLTKLGNYKEALRYLREGLGKSGADVMNENEIPVLNNIGHVHELRNDSQAALAAYSRALKAANRIGDLSLKMAILNNIGRVQFEAKKYDDSHKAYEEAAKLARELGDTYGQMILANNLARWAEETGNIESAQRALHQALDLSTILDDKVKKSGILSNLALIALHAGDAETGLNTLQEALRIMKKVDDPQMLIALLNNIGKVYFQMNDLPHAVQFYSEAYAKAQEIQDREEQAVILTNIGDAAFTNQDWSRAIDYYETAARLYEEVQDWRNLAAVLSSTRKCYINLKNLDKAIELVERALSIDERIGDKVSMGIDYHALGELQEMLGQREKAVALYKRAEALFTEAGQTEYVNVMRKVLQDMGTGK